MQNGSLKRISGYGVAIAAALGTSSKADIISYPNLNLTGSTSPTNTGVVLLSFNLAGDVATNGTHVANEQFYASHKYNVPSSSSGPPPFSKLNFEAGGSMARFNPAPLSYGTLIGFGQIISPSTSGSILTGKIGVKSTGDWSPGQEAFIGLQFDNSGVPLFGWADITTVNAYTITLNSFAYDNTGGPIAAGSVVPVPEPPQIALFALGAAGLAAWRWRKKNSQASQ